MCMERGLYERYSYTRRSQPDVAAPIPVTNWSECAQFPWACSNSRAAWACEICHKTTLCTHMCARIFPNWSESKKLRKRANLTKKSRCSSKEPWESPKDFCHKTTLFTHMCAVCTPTCAYGYTYICHKRPMCTHVCAVCTPTCAYGYTYIQNAHLFKRPMCTHMCAMCTHMCAMCTHMCALCTPTCAYRYTYICHKRPMSTHTAHLFKRPMCTHMCAICTPTCANVYTYVCLCVHIHLWPDLCVDMMRIWMLHNNRSLLQIIISFIGLFCRISSLS